jgi:predicted dehydrogenase
MTAINRRQFLGASAGMAMGTSAFQVLPRHILGATNRPAPNDRLNIAGIGIGGMGGANLRNLQSENIIALCDVDHNYAAKTLEEYPDAKRYTDYREMLDKETGIDAVVIATPDHTHAVIAMAAMRAGKHVYCQKPLTHTVHEARALAKAAEECGVCTQMGIQGHSGPGARQVREWIQAGVIGEVREVLTWCSLTYYPWGHASWSSPVGSRPEETPPLPEGLDWDLWIGPAPHRPYHPCYHPRTWRSWRDFGCGMMGDRGAHTLDPVVWALDLGAPERISAMNTDLNEETFPIASKVRYEFPARGDRPAVTVHWFDGLEPAWPREIDNPREPGDGEGGALFIGEKGLLTCGTYGNSPRLLPESKMKDFTPPPESIPRVKSSHEMDWVRAIKEGGRAGAEFRYAGPLTETALLGNIAKSFPRTVLYWNSDTMRFSDNSEAGALVNPPYREGWKF